MALQVKQVPYEFLARWDKTTGALAGAHVKLLTSVVDSTGVQAAQYLEGDAQPIATAIGDVGFPLTQVLDALHIATLETMQADKLAFDAQVAELTATHDAAKTDLQAQLAEATSNSQALQAELTRVQGEYAVLVSQQQAVPVV